MEICHVCKKEKKPYTVIMTDNILSLIEYQTAREDGEICERCDKYFIMTGEFKDATKEEFEIAKKSVWFADMMLKWWERNKKMITPENFEEKLKNENKREWEGTYMIAKWCRDKLNKKDGNKR